MSVLKRYNGTTWETVGSPSSSAFHTLALAVSDETTAITTGTNKLTFRMPHALTLTGVRASLTTASSSGVVTVDINENGASILSTKLTIDASEETSTTAAISHVFSDTGLADDAEITIDIDTAGTGATGLKVYFLGVIVTQSGTTRAFLDQSTLHATYGDDFAAASLDAKWTRRNIVGGDEAYQQGGGSYLRATLSGGSQDKQYHQAAPAGDFSIILSCTDFVANATATMVGPMIIDSSGNGVAFISYNDSSCYVLVIATYAYSTTGASLIGYGHNVQSGGSQWLRLRKASGNYYGSISFDGANWSPETSAQASAITPNRIGFGRFLTAATPHILCVDRFNVV